MIRQINRFHGHHSVSRVGGSTVHGPLMSLRFAKNHKNNYRLAVVVSKKVAPKAVVRNRIRRRVYEVVRKQARVQNLPLDLVMYVKNSEVSTISDKLLNQQIEELTKKSIQRL